MKMNRKEVERYMNPAQPALISEDLDDEDSITI